MVQTLNFISLSSQQAPNDVDWPGLVKAGVQGALIRLGHGIIRDPCASGHIAKAKQYGLYWHGYHTYEGVVNEPQFTIKNATDLGLSNSQYYFVDLAKSSDPFNDYYALHATWLSQGYSTGLLISNDDYLSKFKDSEVIASGTLRWLISDTEPADYDVWQYSSEGTVGISSVKVGFNFSKTDKLKYNLDTTLTGADINKDPYNPETPVGGAYIGWGYDTTGLGGGKTIGYSTDGKNFYALIGPDGLIVRKNDGNRIYGTIADQIDSAISANVIPAKSAADSAVSAADAAVASAQVTSDAVTAIASATAEAKQGANEAMSRAKSAWDVATGAKEAVTDFDPLLKQAQSDAKAAGSSAAVLRADMDKVTSLVNDPKTGLNATYQTAAGNATTISNVKSDVYQLETTATGLTSRVGNLESKTNTQETAIEQNKNAIALKADQTTVDTIKGTVNQNTATLNTQASQIQAKVSASDVSGMLAGYATQSYAQSLVTQTADKWNLNLTKLQTDVNAIKTIGGGVNLLQGTGTASGDVANGNGALVKGAFNGYDAVKTNGAWQERFINLQSSLGRTNAKAGDWYTISVYVKADKKIDTGGLLVPRALGSVDANTNDGFLGTISMQDKPITTQWQQYSWSFQINDISLQRQITRVEYNSNTGDNWIYWGGWMLEKGTVSHDWSPAPSDMATVTSVTNLSATVDGIQAQVYNSDGSSKITQLSSLIATKVSQGDYNSQITQLKNDINQRVQVGDVISQINQEAGGDTLIQVSNGKKSLILDAGNTIFTGKAWIPSAAISSVQADQVQIGNSRLFSDDGALNLINQDAGTASIRLTTGNVLGTTQPVTQFSTGYSTNAMDISQVGTVIRPSLFFEDYPGQAKDNGWLGFSRHQTAELYFHTYDDTKELFRVACVTRFNQEVHVDRPIWQQGLSIASGNTIWSGSNYLAIGDHLSNSYTNVMARSFSSQSTLSSKTNIETVDPKDALDLVNRTDIRSYQYKADVAQGKTKRYTSLIIDDVNDVSQYYAPDEFTNDERTGRDDGSAVGYLFLAVQELTRRIKNLEDKLNG